MEFETRFCPTLDKPPLFLWWEMDEIIVLVTCIGLSFVFFKEALPGTIAGIIGMWLYIKIFKKRGRVNKVLHHLWQRGVLDYPTIPPGYYRYFWE